MADDSRWITIVVRAWADAGGIRVRLLCADSERGVGNDVVASVDAAVDVVETWLQTLEHPDAT